MSGFTQDEQLINRAGQELHVMLETSPYSPLECLRRIFVPVIEQVRADVKAAGIAVPSEEDAPVTVMRDALGQILDTVTTSLKPDVIPTEEAWQRQKLGTVEAIARKALV